MRAARAATVTLAECEDISAKGETENDAIYAADGTFAARCFTGLGKYIRERGSKIPRMIKPWASAGEDEEL